MTIIIIVSAPSGKKVKSQSPIFEIRRGLLQSREYNFPDLSTLFILALDLVLRLCLHDSNPEGVELEGVSLSLLDVVFI